MNPGFSRLLRRHLDWKRLRYVRDVEIFTRN